MKRTKNVLSILLAFLMIFQISLMPLASAEATSVKGKVAEVSKYGNLTMDFKPQALYDAGFELGDMLSVTLGEQKLEIPFCTSYSDVDTGSLVVRHDKENDVVIVAINMGNFSKTYSAEVGAELTFELKEKAAYLDQYMMKQLTRTNNREDYSLDSVFANFRSIATTGIKSGVLYRSSSPINNEIARAAYANSLAEAVGVKTVLNLADNAEMIAEYRKADDFKSEYYANLFDNGNIATLNMGVDLKDEEFGNKLAEGLKFMITKEAPYLIHCNEGKDRAGFVSAILEALMGASMDEIVADYMLTYANYYGVEVDSEQYKSISESNIIASMTTIVAGLEKGSDLSKVNMQDATKKYLVSIGMTEAEVKSLIEKLSVDSVYKTPSVRAKVTEIEKYGHTLTDVTIKDFLAKGFEYGDMVTVVFDNGFTVEAPFLDGYYVDNGNPLVRAYPGHEFIGVCINYGKMFEVAGVKVGDSMTIFMSEQKGYLTQYEIRNLERTNNREDYASDEVFANFRNITLGNIKENVLYRSSSPINNELGRASYADKLIEAAKVATVVNMADSKENIDGYITAEDFASPYYKSLYENGKVLPLNMGLAYESPEFKASVVEAVKFMANNDGPYLFHCNEGKDRTGFFAALMGSLMGATKEEIVEDYMISYINYYNVEKNSEKYNVISQDVIGMLEHIAGTKELTNDNLVSGAKTYLLAGGVTESAINALVSKLSGEEITMEFSDVKSGDWFYNSVKYVFDNKIMNGTSDTTFAPASKVTRATVATIIWRLAGEEKVEGEMKFSDVEEGIWYSEAIKWAASKEIVKGYENGTFAPNKEVSREELATMLYRFAKTKGQGFVGTWMFRMDINDIAEISDFASEAIHWMYMKGVMTGKDGKLIDPKGTATRAELATMLSRYMQLEVE